MGPAGAAPGGPDRARRGGAGGRRGRDGPVRRAAQPDQALLVLNQVGRDFPQPPPGVAEQRQPVPGGQVPFGGGGVAAR